MKVDGLADLITRCLEHADYLDDAGWDGDGEDVRELIREVNRLTLGWHEEMRQAAATRQEVERLRAEVDELSGIIQQERDLSHDRWRQVRELEAENQRLRSAWHTAESAASENAGRLAVVEEERAECHRLLQFVIDHAIRDYHGTKMIVWRHEWEEFMAGVENLQPRRREGSDAASD